MYGFYTRVHQIETRLIWENQRHKTHTIDKIVYGSHRSYITEHSFMMMTLHATPPDDASRVGKIEINCRSSWYGSVLVLEEGCKSLGAKLSNCR